MTDIVEIRNKNRGPMQTLLLLACPPNDSQEVSITQLAALIGMKPAGVYRWMTDDKIPYTSILSIVAHNNLYWLATNNLNRPIIWDRVVKPDNFIPFMTEKSLEMHNQRKETLMGNGIDAN